MDILRGDLRKGTPVQGPLALTVGNFDGLHKGHQYLLDRLKKESESRSLESVVLSFHPHPNQVITGQVVELLFDLEEKVKAMESLGVDCFALQDFSLDFAQQSAEDFLRQYLFKIFKPSYLLFGHDFNFGKGGSGKFELANQIGKEYGCVVEQEIPFLMDGKIVSSTAIRSALKAGEVHTAGSMLGRPYKIKGNIVHGQGLGKQWGIPTANLAEIQTLLPGKGVYGGYAVYKENKYKAVLNIGMRPTVSSSGAPSVECHILDFQSDIYGEMLEFQFFNKIREERKFPGKLELIEQIRKDIESVRTAKFMESVFESRN